MTKPLDIGETLKLGWDTFAKNAVPLIVGTLLVGIIGGISLGICMGPMALGYCKMCLRAAQGEQVAIGDVFEGFQRFGASFVLFLVLVIALGIGFALFVLPGLVLLFMFYFAFWIMAADEDMGAIDCIKASVELFKRDVGGTIVFVLVNTIVNAIGGIVPLGSLLTGPVAAAMAAHGTLRAAQDVGQPAAAPA